MKNSSLVVAAFYFVTPFSYFVEFVLWKSLPQNHSLNGVLGGLWTIGQVGTNRSYKAKQVTASNAGDLKNILDTKASMKGKQLLVIIDGDKPMVFAEFENEADAILYGFGVMDQAVIDSITGLAEPSVLLPIQMPANMETVEQQLEDVAHDMKVHIDTEGHAYDFGFGLNWKGVIHDNRVIKYKKKNVATK